MSMQHECTNCGRVLAVSHRDSYDDDVNPTVDVAYCDNCDIKYEAQRETLRPELSGDGAASALNARMDALNEPAIELLQQAFNEDAAWGGPIRTSRFADDIETAATASRTTAVEVNMKRLGTDMAYASLRFYGECPVCLETHVAREEDGELTPVGQVDFTMVDGPVKLRCYCGTILEDVTGSIEKEWACEDCGRTYERTITTGSEP